MAEVDTSFYKPNPATQPMTPMQMLQMLGTMNQLKLFEQTYKGREGIADAYKKHVKPDGTTDIPALRHGISQGAGFLAPEAIGQVNSNVTGEFANQATQMTAIHRALGTLADAKNPTPIDVQNHVLRAFKNTNIPPAMITSIIEDMPRDPKLLREWLANKRTLALGDGAATPVTGQPTAEGAPTVQTHGEFVRQRAAPPAPGVAPQAQGGMPSGMPPGFSEAATRSAQVKAETLARATNFGQDIYPMMQALPALERLGKTNTGPGTDEFNVAKSFIQSNLSWLPKGLQPDPETIKDYDTAKKYLTQLAGARASGFGHGTDQALATSLSASPNTHISNLAAVDLTKATIALRRMDQALALEGAEIPEGKWTAWAAKWGGTQDPRVYMMDLMSDEQLDRLQESLKTKAQKDKFNHTYEIAVRNGLVIPRQPR